MAKLSLALRNKGEGLIRSRFDSLQAVIEAKRNETINLLRTRIEAELGLPALRKQRDEIDAQREAVQRQIRELEARLLQDVTVQTAQLNAAASAMRTRLDDQRNKLVEQLWVDCLDSDLRGLVDRVPTAEHLLSNGLGEEIARLNGSAQA